MSVRVERREKKQDGVRDLEVLESSHVAALLM
jgi:hypothetical protein